MKKEKKKLKIILFASIILIILVFTIFYYFLTCKKTYYIGQKNLSVPIYTYHQIVENADDVEIDYMQTTYKNFKKQINGLLKLGYTPITYQDLLDYKNGEKSIPKKSCIITFDDGYMSVYEYVYPFIQEKNIPITLFVVNNLVGNQGYMTWEQINKMNENDLVSVYSHGLNHLEYDKLGTEVLLEETNKSYLDLKEKLGDEDLLKVFAYPCGFYLEDEIEGLANEGFIQNLMDGKINKSKTLDLNRLHRLYPLNDSIFKMIIKQIYKTVKYQ